ncbi:exodeoxyribonuclease V subunit gamma [Aliidiomarina maris]|nr:exodeoxyribonuclease V subunit gamma [Aliidiomarina maris]RAJ96497.1 DNA helicase/exodeoxyribonuclease V gamma subunit [Aliidiomarina maris]
MLTSGFIAAHSHRLEHLTDLAVNLMARYPQPPLAEDVLLVQSNGIAQWLKIQLAEHQGVAAMLRVTLPARFMWQAYRAVLGDDIPRQSPYDKARLRWRLMRLLPAAFDDPDFAALARYTQDDTDQRKLFQLSDKLADLYDQYQVYRAHWLDAWAAGDDVIMHQGFEQTLAPEHRWQAALWRRIVADIGEQAMTSNRAALHQTFLARARALTERPHNLPARVLVFGISSLPKQSLEVLDALKGVCQIVLCVHNPCQYHWADIIDGRELFNRQLTPRQALKSDTADTPMDALHLHAHPLLASWGKQGRDYIRLLDEFDETRSKQAEFADLRFDLFDSPPPVNLLQQLQDDILHLRPVHETRDTWGCELQQDDRSLSFHRCHSAQREVEVLHDQLLAAFAADPSLQPRDVIVMVPDIDQYAAHISAVFGRLQRHDPRYIPFTMADQGQRHRHPILIALESILAAPQQRFTHSDVFDLLHVPAVARRFQLSAQQVELLFDWSAQAGARWGLHQQQRQSLGLAYGFDDNSWLFALKRMLYGYAVGDIDAPPWQQIEPFTEIAGLEAQAAGSLAAFLQKLEDYWRLLSTPKPLSAWYPLLQQLLDDFFYMDASVQDADSFNDEQALMARLLEGLDVLLESVDEAGYDGDLRYNIVQDVWLGQVDESNLNQRFLGGSVNFATLMPMRAIPFRHVCLLGMNDGDYPRHSQKNDFDLMQGHYQPGDRSRREDDRYLFLEALLSARERLYISWVGMSAQDNSELPPSVLVGQLQDHIRAGWQADEPTADMIENLTTRHRLQPFALDYFKASSNAQGLFTYASEWQTVHGVQTPLQHSIVALPALTLESPLSLYDLQWLLREPARLFANYRLGVRLQDLSVASFDAEQFGLDGLGQWQIRQELIEAVMRARPLHLDACQTLIRERFERIRRRGELPLGYAAQAIGAQVSERIETMFSRLSPYWGNQYSPRQGILAQAQAADFEVQCELSHLFQPLSNDAETVQLVVKVSQVAHVTSRSQWVKPKHAIEAWLRHLLATVSLPRQQVTTQLIGDGQQVTFTAIAPEQAQGCLDNLGKWMAQALCSPLATAIEFAGAQHKQGDDFDVQSQFDTLIEQHPYLMRFYPHADALTEAGFAATTDALYQPFFAALAQAQIQRLDA